MNAHVQVDGVSVLPVPSPDRDAGLPRNAVGSARARLEALREIRVEYEDGIAWSWMHPVGRPAVTATMIAECAVWVRELAILGEADEVRFAVLGSKFPGIYNLGGDLKLFAELIRARSLDRLARYGLECVAWTSGLRHATDAGVVTVALVQGTAMGGGFEASLYTDLLVAERQAKFALPEALFNLFPGMGAVSHLARRVGRRRAREMLLDGLDFDAGTLHAEGVVDILADEGRGQDAVRDYARKYRRRHNALRSVCGAMRETGPADAELETIVRLWAEAALRIGETDLRMMEKLVARQERLLGTAATA
ncbi:crotonase/enoyl-CoA hydratase family protein [Methylobacterium sp. 092160098-2]|uniref:crotonase/enoyl-CoA hydratase family protein n=1 Tax=Methylobacterium sp. 092160098-2 TaxID=3025129 RepID=UPI002381A97D|nr:crotonase/enoyl-CoA hydratase family protein [Methylobacterium sp. 092160098-2]MDE4914152.1 crotonase/enoyl-CoA hydratase family protein [Methylobacterium sp. 092160098-2]